jgi:cation diffusion facilitator family transporter
MAGSGHGTKAVLAALIANAGIAVAKFVAWAFTGSSSMLAEGIHSVADSGNQALLLLGGRRARREASATHQFGYGRARYFWSFIVAVVLFLLGGVFALFEGTEKLRHPHEITSPAWAFGVLILGIVLESWSFRTAIVESRPLKGDRTWWQFIRQAKVPELPVVLLEDLGAQVGLILALIGVTLAVTTGEPRWDAAGTLAIGSLLLVIAVILAIEMKSLLLGESADPKVQADLEHALASSPHVRRVIHMRTQHMGPDEILVAAKVEFDHHLSNPELADAIDVAEQNMRDTAPDTAIVYLEPDLHEVDHEGRSGADETAEKH